jgi:hypothetical protein
VLHLATCLAPYAVLLLALVALRARLPASLRRGELRTVPASAMGPDTVGGSERPPSLLFELVLRPFGDLYRGIKGGFAVPTPPGAAVPPESVVQVRMYYLWSGVLRGAGPAVVAGSSAWHLGAAGAIVGWLFAWVVGSTLFIRGARSFARFTGMPVATTEEAPTESPHG